MGGNLSIFKNMCDEVESSPSSTPKLPLQKRRPNQKLHSSPNKARVNLTQSSSLTHLSSSYLAQSPGMSLRRETNVRDSYLQLAFRDLAKKTDSCLDFTLAPQYLHNFSKPKRATETTFVRPARVGQHAKKDTIQVGAVEFVKQKKSHHKILKDLLNSTSEQDCVSKKDSATKSKVPKCLVRSQMPRITISPPEKLNQSKESDLYYINNDFHRKVSSFRDQFDAANRPSTKPSQTSGKTATENSPAPLEPLKHSASDPLQSKELGRPKTNESPPRESINVSRLDSEGTERSRQESACRPALNVRAACRPEVAPSPRLAERKRSKALDIGQKGETITGTLEPTQAPSDLSDHTGPDESPFTKEIKEAHKRLRPKSLHNKGYLEAPFRTNDPKMALQSTPQHKPDKSTSDEANLQADLGFRTTSFENLLRTPKCDSLYQKKHQNWMEDESAAINIPELPSIPPQPDLLPLEQQKQPANEPVAARNSTLQAVPLQHFNVGLIKQNLKNTKSSNCAKINNPVTASDSRGFRRQSTQPSFPQEGGQNALKACPVCRQHRGQGSEEHDTGWACSLCGLERPLVVPGRNKFLGDDQSESTTKYPSFVAGRNKFLGDDQSESTTKYPSFVPFRRPTTDVHVYNVNKPKTKGTSTRLSDQNTKDCNFESELHSRTAVKQHEAAHFNSEEIRQHFDSLPSPSSKGLETTRELVREFADELNMRLIDINSLANDNLPSTPKKETGKPKENHKIFSFKDRTAQNDLKEQLNPSRLLPTDRRSQLLEENSLPKSSLYSEGLKPYKEAREMFERGPDKFGELLRGPRKFPRKTGPRYYLRKPAEEKCFLKPASHFEKRLQSVGAAKQDFGLAKSTKRCEGDKLSPERLRRDNIPSRRMRMCESS